MTKQFFPFLILPLFLHLLTGCSKKETVPAETMFQQLAAVEKDAVLPALGKEPNKAECAQYDAGCKAVYHIKIRQLEAIFVEFTEEKQAQANAEKLNGYWYYNWLLDDVVGEPILEEVIKRAYDAEEKKGH